MRRIVSIVVLVLVGAIAVVLVARPTVVKAGHTAGLSGRTHLIVKEHNLKTLYTECTPICSPTPALRERFRDGSLAGSAYSVPVGRVFIVTDVLTHTDLGGGQMSDLVGINLGVQAFGGGPFALRVRLVDTLPSQRTSISGNWHLSGGVAYEPGSSVAVDFGTGFHPTKVTVLGYETVDVP